MAQIMSAVNGFCLGIGLILASELMKHFGMAFCR